MNTTYPFFISSHGTYKDVCNFESHINRYNAIQKIYENIGFLNYAYLIEKSIFEFCFDYMLNNNYSFNDNDKIQNLYNCKLNDILYDIKLNKNIISDIINKKLDPRLIAFLKHYDLVPDKWKTLLDKKQKLENKLNNIPTSDVYKCYKCGMRKVITYQIQTRGLDEDATTFVKCCNCGNLWRE
jgi:DNA-directed RNA polymerase subunit M/transcription elongation factor TFIIS